MILQDDDSIDFKHGDEIV